MTPLSRAVVITGIFLFTAGTLAWILTGDWQWFAGGGAIFFSSILAGGILSVEVKHTNREQKATYQEPNSSSSPSPSPQNDPLSP